MSKVFNIVVKGNNLPIEKMNVADSVLGQMQGTVTKRTIALTEQQALILLEANKSYILTTKFTSEILDINEEEVNIEFLKIGNVFSENFTMDASIFIHLNVDGFEYSLFGYANLLKNVNNEYILTIISQY